MTILLYRAIKAARDLPPEAQDDIAHILLQLVGAEDAKPVPLTPDEHAAFAASIAAAERSEFATGEEVRAVWAKHAL